MELIAAVVLFAISTTLTPGPNNVMIMTSGLNYGFNRSLPHFMGICVGFPIMVLCVGVGAGAVFQRYPIIHEVIKLVGVVYLIYLAWQIANSSLTKLTSQSAPLTFWQSALFQWVNPKAWVMAMGAIAAFTLPNNPMLWQVTVIAFIFLLVAFPCVGIWLIFGIKLQQVFTNTQSQRVFNWLMASLLVVSILPTVFELVTVVS